MDEVIGVVDVAGSRSLPTHAVMTVSLEDVSRQDVRSDVIGSQAIDRLDQLPVAFSIRYDRTRIDDRHTYVVRAVVTVGEELRYTSDTTRPVITRGFANSAELMLVPVGSRNR